MYDLEVERVSDEIKRRHAGRVLLQLPDGLRPQAFKLVSALRKETGAEILLLGDSCYGACDVALRQAESLNADLLVHYGHSQMLPDSGLPVIYVEVKMDIDVNPLVEKALPLMRNWKTAGLATTVQHVHQLWEIAEALEREGKTVVIGPGGRKTRHGGQVLGCDYTSARAVSAEVDGFLFIGGGRFHPLGLALTTGKPVVAADPYLSSATEIGENDVRRLAMRRMATITAAKAARRLGIIVSLKPGQFELSEAKTIRRKLEKQGREASIICLDEVKLEVLANFSEAEAFINTACPRIAIDGIGDLRKPLLTVKEAYVLLGEIPWKDAWDEPYPM